MFTRALLAEGKLCSVQRNRQRPQASSAKPVKRLLSLKRTESPSVNTIREKFALKRETG
jgi:hypothetical protein